jgi:shikimate dehydrogenase
VSTKALQEILCCMGQPVTGNPTQYLMEKAFAAAGLDWRYLTLEVAPQHLADAVRGMKAMGFKGGNFTIPHKVAVLPLLDGLSPAAELMGAVNCVYRDGDKLLGENTDGKGFVHALKTIIDPQGKKVVLLGAGGAARAVAVELGLAGIAEMTILNRTEQRGLELTNLLNDKVKIKTTFVHLHGDFTIPEETEIFINATSIGLGDTQARVPIDTHSLRAGLVVADVIFNPPRTRLIRDAAEKGCLTLDGLGMLVQQAVIAFRVWSGQDPNAELMREWLEEFLGV